MDANTHEVFISFSFKDQLIAETIVNQLLNKYRISCWICTQDILAGENYKRIIVKAITDAKILLMIQSESSMLSSEVPKEVSIALNKNKTVIPFVIDNSELSEDLEYDLLTVQRIDARRPTLEERIEDLARQICSVLGRSFEKNDGGTVTSSKRKLLSTSSVIPKKIFCGRDDVLKEISEAFEGGERVVFVHGVGGIGKTQIAKQYAKQHKNDYDVIIYATYDKCLRDILLSDSVFSLSPALTRYTMEDGSQEDNDSFFQRKLEAIREVADERTLVLLDNFDVEEDEHLEAFVSAKFRLLVTSRCDYSRYYHTVKVDPIVSIEHLKDIFMQNYAGDEVCREDPALTEMIELVNRHTYTVELLALHMENSGQSAEEMLAEIKKRGIMSLDEEVRNSEMKTSVAYENLLKMFKIFSLTEEERTVLMYLSLMPIGGVNVRNFREWADLSSSRIIKSLETRSWIIRNVDGIALHPIIREVVKHEIPATEENCKAFLDRFTDTILDKKAWHFKMPEKERYLGISKSILEEFSKITTGTEELYYYVQCLASFAFEIDYATELAKRLYDFQRSHTGEKSFKTARAAFKVGWMYANGMQTPQALSTALEWLTLSDEIFMQTELTNTDEISRHTLNKNNLVSVCLKLYDYTGEQHYYDQAVACAEYALKQAEESFKPGDYHYAKIGGAHRQIAKICRVKQHYEEALLHIEQALQMFLDMFGEADADTMSCLGTKGELLYHLGRLKEAEPLLLKSAQGYPEFMGENHPKTYTRYLALADCYAALGKRTEAIDTYARAQTVAEKIFRPDSEQIKTVKDKLVELRACPTTP